MSVFSIYIRMRKQAKRKPLIIQPGLKLHVAILVEKDGGLSALVALRVDTVGAESGCFIGSGSISDAGTAITLPMIAPETIDHFMRTLQSALR